MKSRALAQKPRSLPTLLDERTLPVIVRGRWMQTDHTELRNAAWGVRNGRWAGQDEDRMLAWLVDEVRRLHDSGEPLESLVPSLADLFIRP